MEIHVGTKVSFDLREYEYDEDDFPDGIDADYTVKALNGRFAICTKPCPEHDTVWYSIIDFDEGIRGQNNYVFNIYDYSKQEDIEQCLADLQSGKTEISRRRRVNLSTFEG